MKDKSSKTVGDIALQGISELNEITGDILKERVYEYCERLDVSQVYFRTFVNT